MAPYGFRSAADRLLGPLDGSAGVASSPALVEPGRVQLQLLMSMQAIFSYRPFVVCTPTQFPVPDC